MFARSNDTHLVLEGDRDITIELNELRSVHFAGPARGRQASGTTPSHATEFVWAAGGRLHGTLTRQADEAVIADTSIGNDLRIPLTSLAGIWFSDVDDLNLSADVSAPSARTLYDEALDHRLSGKDVLVTMSEGKPVAIRGRIAALGPNGGRFLLGRKERTFTLDHVRGIVFATGLASGESWPVTVHLSSGGAFPGRLLGADRSVARFHTSFGTEVALPLHAISWLSFQSDRLVYLSDMTPARQENTGLLHQPSPARFDRSVSNGPLMIAGRHFDKGLGVHARSTLEYRLGGAFQTFAVTIGVDDAVRPRGSVVFRIEGDGRLLFDSGPVTGGHPPRSVTVDITGVSTISLTVDYGEDLDLSDHADWADARLIKPPV